MHKNALGVANMGQISGWVEAMALALAKKSLDIWEYE